MHRPEGTEVNVIEPHYSQADIEQAYRQGARDGARTVLAAVANGIQSTVQALGSEVVGAVEALPIPSSLRPTQARMARVGRQLPVRPDQRLPRGEESTLIKEQPARPFPLPPIAQSPLASPLGKAYSPREVAAHIARAWEGPARRNLAPEEPTVHVNQECSPRPDLTLVQEEHGTKRLPRV